MDEVLRDPDTARLRAELGWSRWEAIGHWLSDGQFLAWHERDFPGAIAEYEKAWDLLADPWQQGIGGPELLEGIAEFALGSADPDLGSETIDSLLPRLPLVESARLHILVGKLALMADREDLARARFAQAYEMGGRDAFASDEEVHLPGVDD